MSKKIEINEKTIITLVDDVKEIKTCLLGDEYHPEGMVHIVRKNTECIQRVKRKQMGFFAIIGAAWTSLTIFLSLWFNK